MVINLQYRNLFIEAFIIFSLDSIILCILTVHQNLPNSTGVLKFTPKTLLISAKKHLFYPQSSEFFYSLTHLH